MTLEIKRKEEELLALVPGTLIESVDEKGLWLTCPAMHGGRTRLRVEFIRANVSSYEEWLDAEIADKKAGIGYLLQPTPKAPALETFLEENFGRTTAITTGTCVSCDTPNLTFDSPKSRREYQISGLCQNCQDAIFGYDPGE